MMNLFNHIHDPKFILNISIVCFPQAKLFIANAALITFA